MVEQKIAALEEDPTLDHARDLAMYLYQFKFHITRALTRYGSDYEDRGQKFIALAHRAVGAVAFVQYPDLAQSIIDSKEEIVRDVLKICRSPDEKTGSVSVLR